MSIAMTASWVERVREDVKVREDYYDSKLVGLGLRVSRTGKKVWFVKYRKKGDPRNRRMTLEPYPQFSLADAREAAREVILRASRGEDPGEEKQVIKGSATVKDLARDFIERYAKGPGPEPNKRSWKKDQDELNRSVIPAWGHRKACDITRRDVNVLLDAKVKAGAPIQANRLLALVRRMFNWAIEQDLLETSPCSHVKAPAPENPRDRVLSDAELRALWGAIEAYGGTITPMFKVRLYTAQRGGEVATMRWEQVDLHTGWWTIIQRSSKNKLSHRVPLSEPVVAILRQLWAQRDDKDGGWVFRGRRIGQPYKHIGEPTKVLRRTSGVDFVPHDLRRTAASLMTGMGTSRLVVSKILNHKEAGVTQIYDRHSYDFEKRQALDAWAKRLNQIIAEQREPFGPGSQVLGRPADGKTACRRKRAPEERVV